MILPMRWIEIRAPDFFFIHPAIATNETEAPFFSKVDDTLSALADIGIAGDTLGLLRKAAFQHKTRVGRSHSALTREPDPLSALENPRRFFPLRRNAASSQSPYISAMAARASWWHIMRACELANPRGAPRTSAVHKHLDEHVHHLSADLYPPEALANLLLGNHPAAGCEAPPWRYNPRSYHLSRTLEYRRVRDTKRAVPAETAAVLFAQAASSAGANSISVCARELSARDLALSPNLLKRLMKEAAARGAQGDDASAGADWPRT
jgi:hypothetical protein